MTKPSPDEKEIFNTARQLVAPDARRAYLDQACGAAHNLRARVDALLHVLEKDQSFLQSPAEGFQAPSDEPNSEEPGAVIGPYKLLEPIGEGGFGVVFLAEQEHSIRRRVALKVIKPSMDTRQVVARFEAERQALALMEHPNIARVLDGGETPAGRPCFVMELVRGNPITEYCDSKQLSVHGRLDLFIDT